jgi:beta-galactosidase
LLTFLFIINLPAWSQMRQVRNVDLNWKFAKGDHTGAEAPGFKDSSWETVDVPHDWSIESNFSDTVKFGANHGYLPTGTGWYRKSINLTKKDLQNEIWIEFDGVYRHSDVWINGHHLGHYPNGYNSFHYRLTGLVKEGTNILVVKADNSRQPNSRWYSGSGIYRHVRLILTSQLHIIRNGIYITTPEISDTEATVKVATTLVNNFSSSRTVVLRSIITVSGGRELARIESPVSLNPGEIIETTQELKVADPALWSVEKPHLYTLQSYLVEKGKTADDLSTSFGIRKLEFDAMKGFLLNGIQVKMKGVNLHHALGGVGAAVPEASWERQLRILKEMGCNAIRTSHNPVAPEFLDLCDRLGFLVMNESFDEWQLSRSAFGNTITFGYHAYFDKWHEYDLTQMIRRDRNHPSVVIWSVGNEVMDQTTPTGHETLKKLVDICRREDPTRPVTVGCNLIARETGPKTTSMFLEGLDIVGYNYVDKTGLRRELYFTLDKLSHPERKMMGTENSSIYSYRGEYSLGNDPEVVVADYTTLMIDPGELWKYVSLHDFVMGDFMWTGIDYLGEARWPNLCPPTGVVDRCGFPKDSYYFYQSLWTEKPMLHLFPHWNWPGREGQFIPVLCYSNCDAVELFLNGKSLGEKRRSFPRKGPTIVGNWTTYDPKTRITTTDLHLSWDVPYAPGVLKAVGKKDGVIVLETVVKTSGEPAAVRLSADKEVLGSNSRDVAHIKVEVIDRDGNVVPYAENLVKFSVEGKGKLIGLDNGSHRDYQSMKADSRKVFHGLCLAYVQTTGKEGPIIVSVSSDNLTGSSIVLNSN